MMSPLVGIYELRLADAHLPGSKIADALVLARINVTTPLVHQAKQMLDACVSTVFGIAEAFRKGDQ